MSAFLVDAEHIRALVDSAVHYGVFEHGRVPHAMREEVAALVADGGDPEDVPSLVGRILWAENVKSIEARYPDTKDKPESRPGTIGEGPGVGPVFVFKPRRFHLLPGAVGIAVACCEYQTCEHPEWSSSSSYDFCRALLHAALKKSPGASACPWGIDTDEQDAPADRYGPEAQKGKRAPYCYPADDSVSILSLLPRRRSRPGTLFP